MTSIVLKTADEIARDAMQTPAQKQVDVLLNGMSKLPQVDCPLIHRFTPGMYTREIFMPKGTLIVSKIHKTEHPYVITKGVVSVWIEGVGVQLFKAPYVGVTKPGTRRILFIHENCSWMTFHATNHKTPKDAETDIIYNPEKDEQIEIQSEVLKQLQEEN